MIIYEDVKRWFLEQSEIPLLISGSWPDELKISRFQGDCAEYRKLYKLVGEDYGWVDRHLMADSELNIILNAPTLEIYVLSHFQEDMGFAELDFKNPNEVSLVYFGSGPAGIGKGWGKLFLNWVIQKAWENKPLKLKVNTSFRDHPNALPNYLKAGFKIVEIRDVPQAVIVND